MITMAKWKSPLFSDIRNALGDSVVFSMWKGRPYFRSYVIPANPQTNKQLARRDLLTKLVARWGEIATSDEIKAEWNAEGLNQLISGYNYFLKVGLKSQISVPSTGSTTSPVTITYTLGIPASKAKVYALKNGTTWEDITPTEGLSAGTDQTFEHTFSSAGTYEIYIANADVLVSGDSAPQNYQAITKWKPDITNGVASPAEITIS